MTTYCCVICGRWGQRGFYELNDDGARACTNDAACSRRRDDSPFRWRVRRAPGRNKVHPYQVLAPGCPRFSHGTMRCGCESFRTRSEARAFADSRNGTVVAEQPEGLR